MLLSRRSLILTGVAGIIGTNRLLAQEQTDSLPTLPGIPPECQGPPELRLSYKGFMHCKLHKQYQAAFKNWNCQCLSGQCRPTRFRKSLVKSPHGYDIEVDGHWFPIPANAFKTERAMMTPDLLEWDAHVCASLVGVDEQGNVTTPPKIECAWVKLGA